MLYVNDEVHEFEEELLPSTNASEKAALSIDARSVQSEDFEELARQTTATNQRMILESTSQGGGDLTSLTEEVAQPFVLNPGEQIIVQVSLCCNDNLNTLFFKIPAFINKNLRPYQRIGALFLYTLYKENRGGILADGALSQS